MKKRNPERIPEVLEIIKMVWERNSDLRLMQLLMNTTNSYWIEDDTLIRGLCSTYNTDDMKITVLYDLEVGETDGK